MKSTAKRLSAFLLTLLLTLSLFCGCESKKIYTNTFFEYFDTFSTLSTVAESEDEFNTYKDIFLCTLKEYHSLLDIYNDCDGINNLKALNDNAGKSAVKVDQRLYDFLIFGKEMHSLTNGYTNIAMGSVLSLWNQERARASEADTEPTVPSAEKISEALLHTNIEDIVLSDGLLVSLSDPYMSIDAGALGKGYVTDKLADALRDAGCESFLINLGGNVYARGAKPDGNGWIAGIENPSSGDGFGGSLLLDGRSLVTSGSYQRYFTANGVRYHHIIDPQTGYPENHCLSVSVLCTESAIADALSTALFCMSESDGRALIDSISNKDIEVLWLYEDGAISVTDGFMSHASEKSNIVFTEDIT